MKLKDIEAAVGQVRTTKRTAYKGGATIIILETGWVNGAGFYGKPRRARSYDSHQGVAVAQLHGDQWHPAVVQANQIDDVSPAELAKTIQRERQERLQQHEDELARRQARHELEGRTNARLEALGVEGRVWLNGSSLSVPQHILLELLSRLDGKQEEI